MPFHLAGAHCHLGGEFSFAGDYGHLALCTVQGSELRASALAAAAGLPLTAMQVAGSALPLGEGPVVYGCRSAHQMSRR